MDTFLDEEGISHEFSATYMPQQNGVVERKNHTLIKMATLPFLTKSATLTLLMCCAVLVMDIFMPNLLALLMSTLNGLFGFLRPLLLT